MRRKPRAGIDDFLPGAARRRSGDAAPTLGPALEQDPFDLPGTPSEVRRKKGLGPPVSRRALRILGSVLAPLVALTVMWKLTSPPSPEPGSITPTPNTTPNDAAAPTALPNAPGAGDEPVLEESSRSYALEATALEGLPPDAPAGTRMELWVAWDPPVTKAPKVQRLLREVILEKIVPPLVPEAPATAILAVPAKDVPRLVYGDRYGALSVALLPPRD